MVTTNDPAIGERARMLRAHGMRKRYYHDEIGWNSRLDTIQAAVLLVKLRFIDAWNARRREIARVYADLFTRTGLVDAGPYPDKGVVLPYTRPEAVPVFHQYVIRVHRRDELRAFLNEQKIGSESLLSCPAASAGSLEGPWLEARRLSRERARCRRSPRPPHLSAASAGGTGDCRRRDYALPVVSDFEAANWSSRPKRSVVERSAYWTHPQP